MYGKFRKSFNTILVHKLFYILIFFVLVIIIVSNKSLKINQIN